VGPDQGDPQRPLSRVKTILAGYDGTRAAEHALSRVAELARAFDSKVIVVSVAAPKPLMAPGAFGLTPYPYLQEDESSRRIDETLLRQHRERVQAFFTGLDVPVEFAGVVGEPAEQIVALADEHDADLIVVGTREPGFVERLLAGSVSQRVARRAHRDVLIVHRPDESEA
jgi:nucleotide-binding universal stress UspA family protein